MPLERGPLPRRYFRNTGFAPSITCRNERIATNDAAKWARIRCVISGGRAAAPAPAPSPPRASPPVRRTPRGCAGASARAAAERRAAFTARAVSARRTVEPDRLADEIATAGGDAKAFAAYVANELDRRKLFDFAMPTHGQLDVAFDNAVTEGRQFQRTGAAAAASRFACRRNAAHATPPAKIATTPPKVPIHGSPKSPAIWLPSSAPAPIPTLYSPE